MSEEEEKQLEIFKKEVEKEQEEYNQVNEYTKFFYNNRKFILNLIEQKNNKINKVKEYCNETIEFKDAMNERYDDCYDILKILEE